MDKLQQFFTDIWSIRDHDLKNTVALLLPSIIKGNIAGASAELDKSRFEALATGAPYMARWYELDDLTLPENSVAVIKLTGPLFVWETDRLISTLAEAEANPRICGLVLVVDGPGGMVSHLDIAAAAIRKFSKPTATVVTGIMASAHFWLGTSTDRIFLASQLCEIGSVGILTTYVGYKEYFKMNGIDYREIYPDTADLKNKEVRAIEEKDDESMLKARLEKIHKVFADTVADNLGVAYDPELPLFRGEMFDAEEALALGYADEAGELGDAVRWVLGASVSSKVNELYK